MNSQKYSVNQQAISILLAWVEAGEIAIPEIQRPFVWDSSRVRDLIDSLYQGFPIGYVIAWQNPNVRLKDGTLSRGKKILIDGQQRVTALCAAILGQYVVNKEYNRVKIKIAFRKVVILVRARVVSLLRGRGAIYPAIRWSVCCAIGWSISTFFPVVDVSLVRTLIDKICKNHRKLLCG